MGDYFDRPPWQAHAACRGQGTALFFLVKGQPSAPAKRMCADCPVREPCLDYALEHDLDGIFGGTSPAERARILRTRAA